MCKQAAWLLLLSFNPQCPATEQLADPTRPQLATSLVQEAGESLPRLSAIIIGPNSPHAVLDGLVVKVGDMFGDFEVMAIDPSRVKLRRNEYVVDLELLPGVKKKENKVR